jgi:hypothetical protein
MLAQCVGGPAVVADIGMLPFTCIEDRRAFWNDLCALGPVVLVQGDSSYYLTRREDILAALLDTKVFVRDRHTTGQRSMPQRYYKRAQPLLSPHAVNDEDMRAEMRSRAAAVIGHSDAGKFESLSEFTDAFAGEVFLALMGIPLGLGHSSYACDLPQAVAERRSPFLSKLVGEDDRVLSDDEAVVVMGHLISAGFAGISAAIQRVLSELDHTPSLAVELHQNPGKIPGFADQIFRNLSPSPWIIRASIKDATVAGVTIPCGSRVVLCTEAASVSHAAPNGHLSFGAGAHRCIGHHLSKVAVVEFVGEWLST